MTVSKLKINTISLQKMHRKGFALVASLIIMSLLLMITLGMLTLASTSSQSTAHEQAQAVARANARLALTIALGELQKYAGPDQRATAPSDQLSLTAVHGGSPETQNVNQKHWLGVWPSALNSIASPGSLIGRHDDSADKDNYLVDLREESVPSSGDSDFDATRNTFSENGNLTWLVSSPTGNGKDQSPISHIQNEDSVVIYGKGLENDADWADAQVSVPLVKVQSTSNLSGRYGYWVSDESMKANIAVASRNGSTSTAKTLSQASPMDLIQKNGTPFVGHQGLLRSEDPSLDKVVTVKTASQLQLSGGQDLSEALEKFGHDVTSKSIGLLTNPQTGGFQQDLSAFLSLPTTIDAQSYDAAKNLGFSKDSISGAPGLKVGDPIVYGTRHANTSPRFGALKSWTDLSKSVTGNGAAASIDVKRPAIWSGHVWVGGNLPDITKIAPQSVHPIMTESSLGWDFSYTSGSPQGLRVHIYPKVVLWNPYNVTINAASYLVMMKTPTYSNLGINGQQVYCGASNRFHFTTAIDAQKGFVGFVTAPTAIPPGQALVFTPSTQGASGIIGGNNMKYTPTNCSKNILSSTENPSSASSFYKELIPGTNAGNSSHVFHIVNNAKVAGIPPTYSPSYGFSGDSNSFYANGQYVSGGTNDRFILKALPNNTIPNSVSPDQARTSSDYPVLQLIHAQVGVSSGGQVHRWWSAQKNDHPSNASAPFSSLPSNPPRLWRRGVKLRWANDYDEYAAFNKPDYGTSAFNVNWTSEYDLRGNLVHTSWLGANTSYTRTSAGNWQGTNPGPYIFMWSPKSLKDGTDAAIYSGGNYCASPFGSTSMTGGSISFPMFSIPRNNETIISLGDFQNAQLSYQTYHSSFTVGFSEQSTRSERAATVVRTGDTNARGRDINNENNWHTLQDPLIQSQNNEILLYDMPFEVNHRLFDNYFLSGMNSSWDTETALPNDRLRLLSSSSRPIKDVKSKLSNDEYRFHQSGTFLGNEGAFNVNSTSIPAWTAHLSGLRDMGRDAIDGTASGGSWFSRMQHPVMSSNATAANITTPAAWAGVAALSDADISTLATALVEEVKLRGPFITLSDFVNRRLVSPPDDARTLLYEDPNSYSLERTGKIGALGAAIIKAEFNTGLGGTPNPSANVATRFGSNERAFTSKDLSEGYYVYGSQPDLKTSGLPGSLSQGDILAALAPSLTARGDTFTIRCYGEARDASDTKVLAKAWCEVTVQRMPDYVDSSNDPSVRPLTPASTEASDPNLVQNGNLTEVNQRFGRKFQITSFRWLNDSEI